jgi:hypothetical protein
MAKTTEHGRLIAAAAKAALDPPECIRKDRSRLWYSDQRYWVIGVEFQPSGWSKGSYLNIHVAWLWRQSKGYDYSYRPIDFVPFVNAEQFRPLISNMAAVAAREVSLVRNRFNSFLNIYAYIIKSNPRSCWHNYHVAVASGLTRNFPAAHEHFKKLASWTTHGYAWEENLKTGSAALAALVDQLTAFRSAILGIIEHRRKLMRLPPDPQCLDELDSITAQQLNQSSCSDEHGP